MSAEHVALMPWCAECGDLWMPGDTDRWSALLSDDDPPELMFFCAQCAERELERDT